MSSQQPRYREKGYALLMVLLLAAFMIIAASAAVMNQLTEGRRIREEELIWRGKQYERAVRLYYQKFGRFPQSLDDLVKEQNGVRFLRQPYKDPMNAKDGTWRLIYVTPAGQLIGSVRYTSLQQMALAERFGGAALGGPSGAGTGEQSSSQQSPSPGGIEPNPSGLNGSPSGQNQQPPLPGGQFPFSGQMPQVGSVLSGPGGGGTVFGGNIIGVASKVEKPSLKVYKGGKTYKQWEFIWNPLLQTGNQPGVNPAGTPAGQLGTLPQPNPFALSPTPR